MNVVEIREARPESPGPSVGEIIDDKYEILRDLGSGAASVVFEARHRFTGRCVALKMIAPETSGTEANELEERLLREARALTMARHPGIVDILDAGVSERGPYIALELLQGRTLEGILATRGKMSTQDAVGLALQLCGALATAHAAGVIHRDVKPSNVIVSRDAHGFERVKIVDFGIAQVRAPAGRKLTGIGALIGTPEYMAPEQLLAFDDIDARADVYALGVMLFECLTAQVPYAGGYPTVLLRATGPGPAPSILPLCPTVEPALADAIEKAMAKNRDDRFQTVQDFARALRAAVSTAGPTTAMLAPGRRVAAAESRKAARAPYRTPVAIVTSDGKRWDGRNEDISCGGMLVISGAPCVVGERLHVRFATPVDGRLVTCPTEVRWVRPARAGEMDGLRALGLAFLDVTPQMRASIRHFVEFMSEDNPT
jgi:serine/threonine protein kinase